LNSIQLKHKKLKQIIEKKIKFSISPDKDAAESESDISDLSDPSSPEGYAVKNRKNVPKSEKKV
jgi:hypothetical protein